MGRKSVKITMSVREGLERALAANGAEVEEDIQAYIIGMVEEADDPTELREDLVGLLEGAELCTDQAELVVDALMASVSALVIAEPDSEAVLQTPVAALVVTCQ